MSATMHATIRHLLRADIPEVLAIERRSFEFPWSQEDFVRCLRQRNIVGMVAEHDERVVGLMVYELQQTRVHVVNFAVAPHCRRQGVGRQMVAKLISKLSYGRRTRVVLEVRETNLDAQLFFRECGFRAVRVLHDHYADTAEDAYLFVYRLRQSAAAD